MNNKRAYSATAAFFIMLLFLFSTGSSAGAAALAWNTLLGGSGDEYGNVIAVDSSGNTYVTGRGTADWGSPVRPYTAGADAFVAKLSDNGTLVWNTFLGGSGDESSYGIAVDSSGNVYVSGYSYADWGSPVRAYTAGNDAFVAKLNNSGALVWNTFLGGSGNDSNRRLAIDGIGNIYVTGYSDATWGSPVRAYAAGYDAFISKLNNSGVLAWSTFIGDSGDDYGYGITVDKNVNVYVSGYSNAAWGSPLRAYTASDDAFVAQLNSSGALAWNTFLGGSGNDYSEDITIDNNTNIYVTGYGDVTWGSPVRAYTADDDVFAAKLNSSGALSWNTFIGGSGTDYGEAIAVDAGGNIFMAGSSNAAWGTPLRAYTSDYDAIVVQLADNGALVWNTFLGGSDYDDGYGIAISGNGNLYMTGESDATWGSPVRAYTAMADINVTKILMPPPVQASKVAAANTDISQADIFWTRGSGEKCAVFMKQTDNGSAAPTDGSTPMANTTFAAGSEIPSSGWFCVYNGTGNSVTVTGLSPATSYRIMACEYNGSSGSEQYNTSDATENPANITTMCQLNVIPKKIHKLLSIVEPVKVFVLIGDADTVFAATDKPVWSSTAVKQLLKLKVGKRIILSIVFVNPFALVSGDIDVTVANCRGTIAVKSL